FIGVLGTFVSGSATASNILFTDFQAATARALDLPVGLMTAAQGVGAAIGNAIAPHNIIAGAATVGLSGRDGEVLARTLLPVLAYAGLAGAIVFVAVRAF
ncbi:MAG: L-lactate permease, partial [Spirosomataceae bacterium]